MSWLRNKIRDWLGLTEFTDRVAALFNTHTSDIAKQSENHHQLIQDVLADQAIWNKRMGRLEADFSILQQDLAEQQKQLTILLQAEPRDNARPVLRPKRFSDFKRLMGQGTL